MSVGLSACFHYLLNNPISQCKLRQELINSFQDVEEIRPGKILASYSYLRACIDEALCLSPPGPSPFTREVLRGGMVIDGLHISAGTLVGVPIYVMHRSPRHFPRPEAFLPERWIVGAKPLVDKPPTSSDNVEKARSAFFPFSTGARACIGRGLAYMELSLALARTVWLYDMRLAAGQEKLRHKGMPQNSSWCLYLPVLQCQHHTSLVLESTRRRIA